MAASRDDVSSLGPMFLAVIWALAAIAVLSTFLRLYSKLRVTQSITADDWTITLATLLMVGFVAGLTHNVRFYDWGKHAWDLKGKGPRRSFSEDVLSAFGKIAFTTSTCLVRISALVFMQRLNPYEKLRRVVATCIWINVFWIVFSTLIIFFRCWPPKLGPLPPSQRPEGSRCIPETPLGYTMTCVPVAADIVCWILPLFLIRKFNGSWQRKLKLSALLCLGMLACVAAAFRLPSTYKIYGSRDFYWDVIQLNTVCVLEIGIGILAASAPPLYALAKDLREKRKASQSGSDSPQVGSGPGVHYPKRNLESLLGRHRETRVTTMERGSSSWGIEKALVAHTVP